MANKKRKKTAKRSTRRTTKEVRLEHELPGGFWRQIVAILMIALAVFFVVTWFGHGGTVLNNIHQVFLNVIGFAAYFVPALLVYLAVKIFRSEDNRVAVPVYIASFLMVIWIAGIAAIWQNGGYVGGWLNSLMTNVLDQAVVILIYIVLVFITTAFILQLSPVTFFKGTKNYVKSGGKKSVDEEDGDGKKKKVGRLEIKVNSGLGASEPASSAPTGKLLRKSAIKSPARAPEPVKEPTALIAVSDPDWKMPSTDLLEKKQSPADAGNIQKNADIIK